MTTISEASKNTAAWWVVMGVSGCGKSSLGVALAESLDLPIIEGDDFHPPANIEKMQHGIPLDDTDRAGWLQTLGEALRNHPDGAVLTCSALKRAYRDTLRAAVPGLRFAFMRITPQEAQFRVEARKANHFFSSTLVDSQFATLQDPTGEPDVVALDATEPILTLVQRLRDGA